MRVRQLQWRPVEGWSSGSSEPADLVLVQGDRSTLTSERLKEIEQLSPGGEIAGCSSSGEILDRQVSEQGLAVTAIRFEKTRVRSTLVELANHSGKTAGREIAGALHDQGLTHVLLFADGFAVNASELVTGLNASLPRGTTMSGGLAGDGERFEEVSIVRGTQLSQGTAVAVGLYSSDLKVGIGSVGGWDPFGPERIVTRSSGNVVYEFDGRPALDLYSLYLGDLASELPASGLNFPLSLRDDNSGCGIVRTLLGVDQEQRSIEFAGDVPQGSLARLMKANLERLIDGAGEAAGHSKVELDSPVELGILISCVGRKMILRQRVEEEVEEVQQTLGGSTPITGFYSYGEIAPTDRGFECAVHNQTMTVTSLTEA